jgi:hypothetical protein
MQMALPSGWCYFWHQLREELVVRIDGGCHCERTFLPPDPGRLRASNARLLEIGKIVADSLPIADRRPRSI